MKEIVLKFFEITSAPFRDDKTGKISSTRLIMLSGAWWILYVWGTISLENKALAEPSESVLFMFIALLSAKVGQKWLEKLNPVNPDRNPGNTTTLTK